MDWITWSVEAIGIAIFCIWLIVPIGEFREIFRRLKQQRTSTTTADKDALQ